MRGGDSYELGDLAVGTATAAGEYASDNRERLASVGGSAMGMVAGAALLGPVGILAGGLLGGSAGKSTVKALHSQKTIRRTRRLWSKAPRHRKMMCPQTSSLVRAQVNLM